MSDPKEVIVFVNKTIKLADRDYERSVHDLGYRVVSWLLRRSAIAGDHKVVQAQLAYCRYAREILHESAETKAPADAESFPFMEKARSIGSGAK